MKGDNIIEAYCPVCQRVITQFDVHNKYTEQVDNKWVCIHHLDRARDLFSNPKIMDCLIVLFEKRTDLKEFQECVKETMVKTGLLENDIIHAIKAFCSKVREDQWQETGKYT